MAMIRLDAFRAAVNEGMSVDGTFSGPDDSASEDIQHDME